MSFEAFGVRIGIRSNVASMGEEVRQALPPGWAPLTTEVVDVLFSLRLGGETGRSGHRNFHLLYEGFTLRERTLDAEQLFETLEGELLLTVALMAESYVFVHAGVVELDGAAVVLPGRSGAGKTTLVAALVRAGATYYSDEMAVFDTEGRVLPFARALRLRDGATRRRITPAELGSSIGREAIPVGKILATSYSQDARWRPRPLTPARTLMALFDNAVAAARDPERVLTVLERVIAGTTSLKGRRGEAGQLMEFLSLDLVQNRDRVRLTVPDSPTIASAIRPIEEVNHA